MAREITVLLKNEPEKNISISSRALGFANEFIKSPLFVFVFGASLATAYPTLKGLFTPSSELALQRIQEQARADAILIAPFLGNLDSAKPGQFEATRAALLALEETTIAADNGTKRPIFSAVNKAIEAVAIQIRPPTNKGQLTPEINKQIESVAQPVRPEPKSLSVPLDALRKETLVYIQVERDNKKSQDYAEQTLKILRNSSIVSEGIERLPSKTMPNKTQVRYFYDEDKPKAEQLAAMVAGVTDSEVLVAKPKLDAKRGTLEVWFGKDTASRL